jgi:hypothetical protein
MASHKLAALLRSTDCLSAQQIDGMSEEDAWQWLRNYACAAQPAETAQHGADDPPEDV